MAAKNQTGARTMPAKGKMTIAACHRFSLEAALELGDVTRLILESEELRRVNGKLHFRHVDVRPDDKATAPATWIE